MIYLIVQYTYDYFNIKLKYHRLLDKARIKDNKQQDVQNTVILLDLIITEALASIIIDLCSLVWDQ